MKQLWIRFAAEIKQPSINTLSRLTEDYFRIFREVMTCKDEEIHDALHRGRVFTAEDAVKVGLIQEIRLPVIPVGTKIHHIIDAPPPPGG